MSDPNPVESGLEKTLFASRWLLAPMYLGLTLALAMLVVVFLRDVIYYLPQVLEMSVDKVILVSLTFIDLTLAANLLLIVMFSGYESFVSKLDIDGAKDRPAWMGTVDFGGMKLKLIASIVAISGIHLLKRFMEIGKEGPVNEVELKWMVIIHGIFIVSGVMMAAMDYVVAKSKAKKP